MHLVIDSQRRSSRQKKDKKTSLELENIRTYLLTTFKTYSSFLCRSVVIDDMAHIAVFDLLADTTLHLRSSAIDFLLVSFLYFHEQNIKKICNYFIQEIQDAILFQLNQLSFCSLYVLWCLSQLYAVVMILSNFSSSLPVHLLLNPSVHQLFPTPNPVFLYFQPKTLPFSSHFYFLLALLQGTEFRRSVMKI